jgi:hypothetical protein
MTVIYCGYCGVIPGDASECVIVTYGHATHDFTKSDEPVVCQYCGAAPGKTTECIIEEFGFAAHRFVKASELR